MNSLDDLRRFAVSRSLFEPTTLQRAIDVLGFVQADPIRAPARAQDLTLRPRVDGYHAGDLERDYPELSVEEDVFINYGFVSRSLQALMHPRTVASLRPTARNQRAQAILAFVRDRGAAHPRDVEAHFSHGRVTNYWGGSSHATTHLLEAMHYKGQLRVVRRDGGVRVYAVHEHGPAPIGAAARDASVDAIVDVAVGKYAPLPAASLSSLVSRLRYAVPQWRGELRRALERARQRLRHARIDGIDWYWPADESYVAPSESYVAPSFSSANCLPAIPPDRVTLLAPFDPIVWDRRRFEMFWGWAYRFEAYTPVSQRKLGYYALPLLWRDRIVGWGNVSVKGGKMDATFDYVTGRRPRDREFIRELDAEVERIRVFLGRMSTV